MVLDQQRAEGLDLSEQKPAGPSAIYWSPQSAMLAAMIDKLSVLIEAQSSRPKRIVPYPRPRTAFDKVMDQVMMAKKQAVHDYLVGQMIAKPKP